MLTNSDFEYTAELTTEQNEFVLRYLHALYDDNKIIEYWDMISDIDKALAFGYIDTNRQYQNPQDPNDLITHLRQTQRELYSTVRENGGVSKTVRYTKHGEAYIYLVENTLVPRIYIAPTPLKTSILRVIIDAKWENNNIVARLKARIYDDAFRSLIP